MELIANAETSAASMLVLWVSPQWWSFFIESLLSQSSSLTHELLIQKVAFSECFFYMFLTKWDKRNTFIRILLIFFTGFLAVTENTSVHSSSNDTLCLLNLYLDKIGLCLDEKTLKTIWYCSLFRLFKHKYIMIINKTHKTTTWSGKMYLQSEKEHLQKHSF